MTTPLPEDLPLRHRQSRVYDAEKIRQEFILSQGSLSPSREMPASHETPLQAEPEPTGATIQDYLKSLDQEQLDQVLSEVLTEVRSRDSEQMKRDVLTHSQKLRLQRPID